MEMRGRLSMETWLGSGFKKSGLAALLVQNDRAAIGAMSAYSPTLWRTRASTAWRRTQLLTKKTVYEHTS